MLDCEFLVAEILLCILNSGENSWIVDAPKQDGALWLIDFNVDGHYLLCLGHDKIALNGSDN